MTVTHEVREGVSHVRIERPQAMNSFDLETASELSKNVEEAMGEGSTRAVVVSSQGDKAFCTGADLGVFADAIEEGRAREVVHDLSSTVNEAILGVVEGSKPVVGVVDGVAAGGGLGLALACDVRVGSPRTRLVPAFLGVGVSPDAGTTWFLPRMIGAARASEMILRNEALDAEGAHERGLVSQVHAEPGRHAHGLAGELADGPARATAWAKQRLARTDELREHLAYETEATARSATTEEFQEGVRAFLEDREPEFAPR